MLNKSKSFKGMCYRKVGVQTKQKEKRIIYAKVFKFMKNEEVESYQYNKFYQKLYVNQKNVIEWHLSRFKASLRRVTLVENELNRTYRTIKLVGDSERIYAEKRENSKRLRCPPSRTPEGTSVKRKVTPVTLTTCFLPVTYDLSHSTNW